LLPFLLLAIEENTKQFKLAGILLLAWASSPVVKEKTLTPGKMHLLKKTSGLRKGV